jgi:gluconate 2-dehydrogenase gamma chain
LGGAITLVCAAPLWELGCSHPGASVIDGFTVPAGTYLPASDYARLAALMDALVPGDPSSPGALDAHAPWYLDQLLGAFRSDPPRIYAGGPYSGRHGGLDGFSQFQPLTRVEALRWRTYLEGSQGIREREWNGPVKGILDEYREGLAALDAAAHQQHGRPFTALSHDERVALVAKADEKFVEMAYTHAVEGTYADPVYGGNFEEGGWRAIAYEGDRQPVGYTARQMSNPEDG